MAICKFCTVVFVIFDIFDERTYESEYSICP